MRQTACLIALLVVTSSSGSAEPPKPNTLTPKEIADGWLLLFDGETTFGWNIDGEAKVKDGLLTVGGTKEATIFTSSEFGEFVVEFEARVVGKSRPADFPLSGFTTLRWRKGSARSTWSTLWG